MSSDRCRKKPSADTGGLHETTGISQGGGRRDHRIRGRRSGHRPIHARARWRLTASWPKSLDTLYGAPDYMANCIAELSDNKFHIQVFAAGEIVPGLQVLDAVQNGTVEMGHTASCYYFGKDP